MHRAPYGGDHSGRRGAADRHLAVRAGAVLRAGLGGGENQPKAEEQELYHGAGIAGVFRVVLFRLLPVSGADRQSAAECRQRR